MTFYDNYLDSNYGYDSKVGGRTPFSRRKEMIPTPAEMAAIHVAAIIARVALVPLVLLLLFYISVLFAMGFGPVVNPIANAGMNWWIRRKPNTSKRAATILFVGMKVVICDILGTVCAVAVLVAVRYLRD